MRITKWNNVTTWELLSQNVFGWKRPSNVIFFFQRRMWKVLCESLKQKMCHLSEADKCHELGPFGTWFRISFRKLGSKYICGCCQHSYHGDSGLHTQKRKALRQPPSYEVSPPFLSLLTYLLFPKHPCVWNTIYCHLWRKTGNPSIMPGPYWVDPEAIPIKKHVFKNKVSVGGSFISSPSSTF